MPGALTLEHLSELRAILDEMGPIADASGREELALIFQRLLRISNFAHGK